MSSVFFLLAGLLATVLPAAVAQSSFTSIGNTTSLTGTWSSGSQAVLTGVNFYNPVTKNFTVPPTSGVSYSFTDDGFFETSTFTYTSNSTQNRCFSAALTWQHGTYTFNANNSISLHPFVPDGYVQVMDPCAGQTIQQYLYNQFELIPQWITYQDDHPGFMDGGSAWALQMYNDGGNGAAGAPKSVMWLANRPPTMLPTVQLYQQVLNAAGATVAS
ncbi:hypothetical protein CBS101457_002185 [Exobasidium rhododendri]|nr:hypothetical protein CBS101457_002185 [Exobasidium rhododendri]